LLSLELTGNYAGSLLCGYLFTFSEYHFAHGQGHLQLVALQWIPLFLLLFWRVLTRPSVLRGLLAAFGLFLVILCDYYYFFFSIIAGAILLGWYLFSRRSERPWLHRPLLLSLGTFAAGSLLLCGPLVLAVVRVSAREPLFGAHDPNDFSMDLLGPLVPGGTWRFSEWTRWYWQRLPGNLSESSVSWGLGAIALMLVAWTRSRNERPRWLGVWSFILAVFALLALGPQLRLLGQPLGHVPGPFTLLVKLVPAFKLAGTPARMSVMISLCVALIAGAGFALLWRGSGRARALGIILAGAAVFQAWPMHQTLTSGALPPYASALRSLPRGYGLLDVHDAQGAPMALYAQTGHELPMAYGYIARTPASVARLDAEIDALAVLGRWQILCEKYGLRYLVFDQGSVVDGALAGSAILEGVDPRLRFYDLGRFWSCASNARGPFPPPDLPLAWQSVGPREPGTSRGARCNIDSVNFRDLQRSRLPIEMPRSGSLNVVGWAVESDTRPPRAPPSLRLRLERADGTGFEAPARRSSRPDVAEYFKDPDLGMAGFQILGGLPPLPPDLYRLAIVQEDVDGRTVCESAVTLRLL
jgi:hypothetical protein